MSWGTIRAFINTKLQSITNIEVVYNYPTVPKAFPGATVTPSEVEADYETTIENIRYYGFVIRLFYKTDVGISGAVTALEGLVDEVVDAFDKDPQLTGISMPAKYTLIQTIPTPSAWIWDFIEDEYIVAPINIRVMVSFDIT